MTQFPTSEWDRLLRSPMRLAEGVGLRINADGCRCLHDVHRAESWILEPWQSQLLREIEQGSSFGAAVHDVVRSHPESATRGEILRLIEGLCRVGFLRLERPVARREKARPVRRPHWNRQERRWFAVPLHWACQLAFGATLAAGGGWTLSGWFSTPSPPLFPAPVIQSVKAASNSEIFAWEEASDEKVAVRVWCHGVITELLVRDGDVVRSGDVLARVADPMAIATRDDLRTLLAEFRVRRDEFYIAGDLVAYLRESKAMARLTRELSEWERQSGAVDLKAPINGKVRRGWFAEAVGDRVTPGEVLMAIEVPSGIGGVEKLMAQVSGQ